MIPASNFLCETFLQRSRTDNYKTEIGAQLVAATEKNCAAKTSPYVILVFSKVIFTWTKLHAVEPRKNTSFRVLKLEAKLNLPKL